MVLRYRPFFAAALSLIAAAPLAAVSALERGVAFIYGLFVPATALRAPRLAVPGPAMNMTRAPFAAALQNSLRHEAGHRKRAASRGG